MNNAKREGVLLAQEYNSKKHLIGGQYMSVKLDGQRIWWDGGISVGEPVTSVPWAFNPKAGLKSSGLWTRNFKAVIAPRSLTDTLPRYPLDGEAWLGNGRFEELESVVRTEWATDDVASTAWKDVQYRCFDVPSYSEIFRDGRMRIRKEDHYIDCVSWVRARTATGWNRLNFEQALQMIPNQLRLEQVRLPLYEPEALEVMWAKLNEVTDSGGEGVMVRRLNSIWTPKRSDDLLKIKKFYDAEGIVVGYEEGVGRLKGMVGAVVLEGIVPLKIGSAAKALRRFKISGFTDAEREKAETLFPLGSEISYRYNEITDDGMPRFGRYWRRKCQV